MAVDPQVENRISRILRSQNAAISYEQLMEAGLTRAALRARVSRGSLVAVFYRVYVAGDPELLPLARETAALLSVGPASVLSHRSAAAVWGITPPPDPSTIHVTVVGNPRPRAGIRLHHVAKLHPDDIRTHSNLRLTSPARALLDMAADVRSWELDSAFGEARANRLITDIGLQAALNRVPRNHPGAAIIRRRLRGDAGSTYTRSGGERRMRWLMKMADLPQPMVNVQLCGFTADFFWPGENLILEVDGYTTHGDRLAFERDRRRDQVHVAAGYTVIRVTWDQLRFEPFAVVARIAQALARRAA